MKAHHSAGAPRPGGQALLEFLVLLPVLFLLFLATAEISRLFVISGKTEVAARYAALHLFRPENNPSVHNAANRYNSYLEDAMDPADPDSFSAQEVQTRLNDIFFEGVLNDSDHVVEDTEFYEFQPGDAGIFEWNRPPMGDVMLNILIAHYSRNGDLFPMRGDRVTFEYNLPFFPHNRGASYWDVNASSGVSDWEDPDPLGNPYPLYTAKGDFVIAAPTFAGNTGEFISSLEEFTGVTSAFVTLLQLIWLLGQIGF